MIESMLGWLYLMILDHPLQALIAVMILFVIWSLRVPQYDNSTRSMRR